jgi:tetratricopeptide (TPR) repeat protein
VGEEASVTGLVGELEEFGRFWESADGGDVDAMAKLANLCDGEARKDWLRRAADGGDWWSPHDLAVELVREGRLDEAVPWYQRAYKDGHDLDVERLTEVLLSLGRLDEAERWARQVAETRRGQVPTNQCRLARVLLRLGKLDEAESWARRAAENPPVFSKHLRVLADVLDRQGNSDEAEQLREQARSVIDPSYSPGPTMEVVLTAAASVAVAPFVNALMSRAGEDTYAGARALVKWLFKRGQPRKKGYAPEGKRLLIVEDPDPKLNLAIWLGTDTPDKQLRALKDLDVDSVATDARRRETRGVRIQWDEASHSWKALDQ